VEKNKVVPGLSIAKCFVVSPVQFVGSGIKPAEGLDVSHWNIVLGELGGMHPADASPDSGGNIKVVSIASIYVFYVGKVLHWEMLISDK